MTAVPTAQEEFDQIWITSSEICRELRIDRSTIVQGRKRGLLPDPVKINGDQILLWKREDVRQNLDAWKLMLKARRGELNT
jgi:hypothetical protein